MQCPKCQFENPGGIKFCGECGARLERLCPSCNSSSPANFKFCGECGHSLIPAKEISEQKTEYEDRPSHPSNKKPSGDVAILEGERKHVTVLFSDLTGYTAMSEKLDPEEVREITSRIFREISKIVGKFDGFIEKYAGDAVMALFGVNKSHEDDPVRAVKSAIEIHDFVNTLSPHHEEKIGQPLAMHSGINTGLVVTGELNLEKGVHGVAGDTVNVASRLSSIAKSGDILVGPETYSQSERFFNFESIETAEVNGKVKPIQIYKYLSTIEQPRKIHRLQGLRADLIGRKAEMAQLSEAINNLSDGQGSVFSIIGTAGTGKSRLVEEFKATLNIEEVQWREGQAYPYSQNIPYFPLVDLINRTLQIKEEDSPEKIREKIDSRIESLLDEKSDVAFYIGSLYALSYPEIESVSPEFWKSKLHQGMKTVLSALAQRGPTVICFEDLHWADPSSLDLVRFLLSEIREPIIFICVYRPIITLFTSYQINSLPHPYHEINLQDLSRSESQEMVQSLMRTGEIPFDLQRFIQEKVEGNPFYLEEVINSLIESDFLVRDNGGWRITQQIRKADISSTIQGVISARVDRLEEGSKKILQEASVIGRTFYYEILNKISELKGEIDKYLSGLERLDFIKAKIIQPELEYFFKHSLTQEVVYNSLLKKERRIIHKRIGQVIEQLFSDRLPEFYETLAYHFKTGQSARKAIDYLMKAGEKSLARYALEESNQYYTEAYQLIVEIPDKAESDRALLIDLLMKWALVFYYQGEFGRLTDLFEEHLDIAETLDDKSKYGMFYAWLGFSLIMHNRIKDSYEYLREALEIGEQLKDQKLIGYSCTWLPWTCAYYGLLDEAIDFGERAQNISKIYPSDQYMYFKSLGGMALANYLKGNKKEVFEIGKKLVDFGCKQSNIRSQCMGHAFIGFAYALEGNLVAAVENGEKAINIAADPFYAEYGRHVLGRFYILNQQIDEAEKSFQQTLKFSEKFRIETVKAVSQVFLGLIQIIKGQMSHGMKLLKTGLQACSEGHMICEYCLSEYLLGFVYLQMVQKAEPISFGKAAKNIGFLLKNVPIAAQKAETHFTKSIEIAKKTGANSILGLAYLHLGLLHRAKNKSDKANECISEAIKIFDESNANVYLKQAKESFESLQ